jgi:hypothetical protein
MKSPSKSLKTAAKTNANVPPPPSNPQTSLIPFEPSPEDILVEPQPNPNKMDVMQPDLLGSCTFGGIAISLAFWNAQTRDGQRMYYSLALNDTVKQKQAWQEGRKNIEPLHRLKLYEFRKGHASDPDFATTECFIAEGKQWWAFLWVLLPEDPNDVENIRYYLLFSPKRFKPALSDPARENAARNVARLLQRREELDDTAYYKAFQAKQEAMRKEQLGDYDDIPSLD